MTTNIHYNPSEQRSPRRYTGHRADSSNQRRLSTQQQERVLGYTATRPLSPTAAEVAILDLSRQKGTSRKYQRPWTLKEWDFVEKIPKDTDEDEMQQVMFKFQDNFKWTPTEGQLRSQYWYFEKSARKMREFLKVMQRMSARDGGGKQSEVQMVSRMKTGTLRLTW